MTGRQEYDRNMTGRQDDRQRTLDEYMIKIDQWVLASRARPCAARTRLFWRIATPNGGAARPPPIAASLLHIHWPKNLLFPETKASFRPELGPPGSNIFPLDHRGFEI